MPRSRSFSVACAVVLAAAIAPAIAQQTPPMTATAIYSARQPYGIETFGEFRKLIQQGDFAARVKLRDVMARRPTTGVGALADARGEITIHDGKLVVSYGKAGAPADAAAESAALLALGAVGEWQSIAVDKDVAPTEIETYLAAVAREHGIDTEKSFPFELRGTLISCLMHVNAAPTNGPHGMGLPVAIAMEIRGDEIDGSVAGIYVSADLVGIATHGGERTHAHWLSPDGSSTAHLDRWGVKAGSVLRLPKP